MSVVINQQERAFFHEITIAAASKVCKQQPRYKIADSGGKQ
ncbi:MAG TPA: hypothetical protein VMJ32_05680 [Pirellulales bacterium]|nr:hypothetical protein [Pirellulales bacterium]